MKASLAPKKDGHVPSPEELGKLPWRLEAAPISSQTRIAGLLIWLTAQRIATVISARKEDFEPCRAGGIWTIPAPKMKSKRIHVLPLGQATRDLVAQAMALAGPGPGWLFPQVRPRRAGGPADGHISYKPVAGPLDPLDPHDFRRAFATHGMARLGIKLSDVKAILDHAEGKTGDVTLDRYALHDGTHFKWPIVLGWERFLLDLAVRHSGAAGATMRTLLLSNPTA